MAGIKTHIIGLTPNFRAGDRADSFRVGVLPPNGKNFFWISAKVDPKLKEINHYLRESRFHEADALADPTFNSMVDSLYNHLRSEYGLKEYQSRVQVDIRTKAFNFEQSLEDFCTYKSEKVSTAYNLKSTIEKIWLPYFISQGCNHPSQFHRFAFQAENFLRTTKKQKSDERYSRESLPGIASALHEYLKFLKKSGAIHQNEVFYLDVGSTLEQKKRGRNSASRRQLVYSLEDLFEIKRKIDSRYSKNEKMKLRAYGILFGVYTGIRRGNALGLRAKNLFPEDDLPHFMLGDNILPGFSRGVKGKVSIPISTKTTVGDEIALPLVQPSVEVASDVARFLKNHLKPDQHLIECEPNRVAKWWRQIARDCGFIYLSPHDWKHSYATNGAFNLQKWYKGNPYLLQQCCLHRKFETTQKYIRQTSKAFLEAFR